MVFLSLSTWFHAEVLSEEEFSNLLAYQKTETNIVAQSIADKILFRLEKAGDKYFIHDGDSRVMLVTSQGPEKVPWNSKVMEWQFAVDKALKIALLIHRDNEATCLSIFDMQIPLNLKAEEESKEERVAPLIKTIKLTAPVPRHTDKIVQIDATNYISLKADTEKAKLTDQRFKLILPAQTRPSELNRTNLSNQQKGLAQLDPV